MMQKNEPRSLAMFLSSMLIYGTIGIFRRQIPLSSSMLACFRGACGALLLLLVFRVYGKKRFERLETRKLSGLLLSGGLMGFNWILLFEAYNYTTVATATLCYYMQPTIVMLLSPLLFRERMTLKKGLCCAAALAGMVLVSGVADSGIPSVSEARGVLLGLGAAVLYSSVVILNKKITGVEGYQKTILQLAAAAVVLVPYNLLVPQELPAQITANTAIMLLIVGFVHTGVAYALYFGSMDGLRTQTVAILSYVDPVTALILSALLLHEPMTVYGIIGAALIIGAAFISELNPGQAASAQKE